MLDIINKRRAPKGSVYMDQPRGTIRIRFRYNKVQYCINSKMLYTEYGILQLAPLCTIIQSQIITRTVDTSLNSYKALLVEIEKKSLVLRSLGTPKPKKNKGKSKKSIAAQDRNSTSSSPDQEQEKNKMASLYLSWLNYKEARQLGNGLEQHHQSVLKIIKRWGNVNPEYEEKLYPEKWSPATFNDRLSVFNRFFTWAVKQKHLPENPLSEVPRKKRTTKDSSRVPFTQDELKRIIHALESDQFKHPSSYFTHSHYAPFFKFMVLTGVRNAEAIGLTIEKIDFDKGIITIDQALARTKGQSHAAARKMKETKSGNIRLLPLTDELTKLLWPLCNRRGGKSLVFRSHKGGPIDDHRFQQRVFKPVLEGLNIPYRVLYAVRHSFGTRAIEQGMSVYDVAQLMGHSTIETTMRNYIHFINRPKTLPDL